MDRIWRDLTGGGISMLAGSGRILRSVMDDTRWIAMERWRQPYGCGRWGGFIANYFTWLDYMT